jgi:hypothetical protein
VTHFVNVGGQGKEGRELGHMPPNLFWPPVVNHI